MSYPLPAPQRVQAMLIDRYRTSDAFRDAYSSYMLSTLPDGLAVSGAIAAVREYGGIQEPDMRLHGRLIGDVLYTRKVLGFLYWEYFGYGFERISIKDRLAYLSDPLRTSYMHVLNPDRKANNRLTNKGVTASILPDFYKRGGVDLVPGKPFDAFALFCRAHPRFIVKPIWRSRGEGVHIVDSAGMSDRQLALLARRLCAEDRYGVRCEELIVQDDRMAAAHPVSVNTVRLATYVANDGSIRPICAFMRSGRGASIVDNGGAGGILAGVDVGTGTIFTDAGDEAGHHYERHPDTGFRFRGFQLPRWDECVSDAIAAAGRFPGVRLIGWDLALSRDKGWQIVEGNYQPQLTLLQLATRRGMREEFEASIEWRTHAKDMPGAQPK